MKLTLVKSEILECGVIFEEISPSYCVVVVETRQVQFVMPFIFVGHEKKGLRYPVKMGLKT